MRKQIRRAGCLLILLVMLPAAGLAGTIDQLIGLLSRPARDAVTVEMQAEVLRMPEMGETRTEWINRLLKHITFRMTADAEIRQETIGVDGQPAISCAGRAEAAAGIAWQFSFDSRTAYRTKAGEDLLSILSGVSADTDSLEYYSRMAVLMDGFYRFFEGLPAAFPEAASLSKTNIRYKPYGTAVKKWSVSLPEDVLQSEQMIAYLDTEGLEAVKEYLSGAVLSGRQRFTLLMDENDHLMKVNYTAKAGLSEDDLRSVNLDWRCLRREEGYKDILTLTTPGTGSRRNNVTITQEMVIDPETGESYTGRIETDRVENRIRTRILLTFDLKAMDGTVTGELLEKTTAGSTVTSTGMTVELTQNTPEEYRGSIEIICKLDKIEKEHYLLRLTAGKAEPLQWNELPVRKMRDKDRDLLAEKAAVAFLKALVSVPEEDLQYILADLPDGLWAQLNGKTDETEETEQP